MFRARRQNILRIHGRGSFRTAATSSWRVAGTEDSSDAKAPHVPLLTVSVNSPASASPLFPA
jgi:hypothetical protein